MSLSFYAPTLVSLPSLIGYFLSLMLNLQSTWTSLQMISIKVHFLSECCFQMCFSFSFYPCYKPIRMKYLIHLRYLTWYKKCASPYIMVWLMGIGHRFVWFPGKVTIWLSLSLSLYDSHYPPPSLCTPPLSRCVTLSILLHISRQSLSMVLSHSYYLPKTSAFPVIASRLKKYWMKYLFIIILIPSAVDPDRCRFSDEKNQACRFSH